MKKTLLLSVVASTMIMAGGDIAPVEPVVETPAVAVATSGWDFSGQAVVYYQTAEAGTGNLFDQENSAADAGLQLRAVNKDLFAGIGAGVEVSGLSTLNLENGVVDGVMQTTGQLVPGNDIDDVTDGGWISQAYLTYAAGNTSFKAGRQELPKALSPFAFSEGWNVFKNTFDAVLVVNTDITDTTLVGAWVAGANYNGVVKDTAGNVVEAFNMTDFNSINGDDGVFMLTAQNKSIDGLTLTGSYYYIKAQGAGDDSNLFWADAKYAMGDYALAGQFGYIDADSAASAATENAIVYGAKVATKVAGINASVAYSHVNEADVGVFNVGGVKTPLYTQMILNQGVIANDADYIKVAASTKLLNGNVGLAYGMRVAAENDTTDKANPYELDVTYSTKVLNGSTTLLAAYVMVDPDTTADTTNVIRVWGRYNF
jgi:hypothetical protein